MSGAPSLTPLHPQFGAEVHGIDLREVTADDGYAALRAAFEEHSLLLFRGQQLLPEQHLQVASLFGPIEDRREAPVTPPEVAPVSNRLDDGTVAPADGWRTLDLIGNQLWHTDSTFLPVPALANLLAAAVLPPSGGETQIATTRAAWADIPERLRTRFAGAVVHHRLAHSRARIAADLAAMPHITRFADQSWRAIWPNPVNGREALYLASHAFGIDGLPDDEAQALIDEAIDWCTQDRYVYTHTWLPGDVLVWDERATLHRGRPWPYEHERTLVSVCVSATEADGLNAVRPVSRR